MPGWNEGEQTPERKELNAKIWKWILITLAIALVVAGAVEIIAEKYTVY